MNIVPSTSSATPTAVTTGSPRAVGPTTGHIVSTAVDGVDVPASGGTPSLPGFGKMLSRHLDDALADAKSDPKGDAAGDAARATTRRGPTGLDAKAQGPDLAADANADRAAGVAPADADPTTAVAASAALPQDAFPTLAAATTAVPGTAASVLAGASQKSRPDDDDRATDGDAGSDLAAQLALASQWTGVAHPAGPATATSTPPAAQTTTAPVDTAVGATVVAGSGTATGGLDLKTWSGKDRAASRKDDATPLRDAATTGDATAVTTATTTHAAGADPRERDDRGTPPDATPVVAAKDDAAKTRGEVVAVALDAAAAGAGTATRTDTVAAGDAFAVRLAAHLPGAAATSAAAAATAPAAPAAFAFVQEPVGSSGWSHEVGQATLRMAANDLQSASLRLNPEHLGPLDVQVRVDNGIAHVAFNATHVDTRQALEASRGTLDQLFTSQGLKMGDVSVGSGSTGGSNDASAARGDASADASRRDGGSRWSGDEAGSDGDAPVTTVTTRIARALGLVDTFA